MRENRSRHDGVVATEAREEGRVETSGQVGGGTTTTSRRTDRTGRQPHANLDDRADVELRVEAGLNQGPPLRPFLLLW